MKAPNLVDVIELRRRELSRLLGGCCAVRPVEALAQLDAFDTALMPDGLERSFIWELRKRRGELRRAGLEEQAALAVQVVQAGGLPLCIAYTRWLSAVAGLGRPIEEAVRDTCRELQVLAIGSAVFHSLAQYAVGIEEKAHWGVTL
jgi:hypothetical protein